MTSPKYDSFLLPTGSIKSQILHSIIWNNFHNMGDMPPPRKKQRGVRFAQPVSNDLVCYEKMPAFTMLKDGMYTQDLHSAEEDMQSYLTVCRRKQDCLHTMDAEALSYYDIIPPKQDCLHTMDAEALSYYDNIPPKQDCLHTMDAEAPSCKENVTSEEDGIDTMVAKALSCKENTTSEEDGIDTMDATALSCKENTSSSEDAQSVGIGEESLEENVPWIFMNYIN